jgi:ABC-type nitrate/sulfonate/bicarbonate transport system ATPase subunit
MQYLKADTLLKVENVNKAYDGKVVLRDINFVIKDVIRPNMVQGQVLSLVGQSGIGKSTLFDILAGKLAPDSGSVLIGKEQTPAMIGSMGVVLQDYFIYPWRRVQKILAFAVAKNTKIAPKDRESEIQELVEKFQLSEHLSKFPFQLSGGQKQRVSIAEQLLIGNDFILLDEPFSGLDGLMIDKVTALLDLVSRSNELKTLIIISHDLSNSLALSDTVFIMAKQEGKLGATITQEIDLIGRGLCWQNGIKDTPQFRELLREVKADL